MRSTCLEVALEPVPVPIKVQKSCQSGSQSHLLIQVTVSDQENSTPSTSYCALRDDESVGAMHLPISSGDFGQVAQLKAKRQLTDHEKPLCSSL